MGGMFSKPKMPKVQDTPVMPLPDDEEIARRRRRKTAELLTRSGRESTILTQGGQGYGATNNTLG